MAGGSWVASLFSGYLSDAIGRRRAVMCVRRLFSFWCCTDRCNRLATIVWVLGCIITSTAQNIPMLIVGRVLNGLCVSMRSPSLCTAPNRSPHPGGRLLRTSTRLHQRNRSTLEAWPTYRPATMGDHMGYTDHVLHLLRLQLLERTHGVSHPVGAPDDTCHHPLHRNDLST